jgi:hypothetical protein
MSEFKSGEMNTWRVSFRKSSTTHCACVRNLGSGF